MKWHISKDLPSFSTNFNGIPDTAFIWDAMKLQVVCMSYLIL